MSMSVSRRNFMKAAGVAAGTAVAANYSPLSYAQNEKVSVACIGTGGQGGFHLYDGLGRAQGLEVVAVCDVYIPHLDAGYTNAGGGKVKKYMDYRELLDKEPVDAVVIATPLHTHHQITMDCLDAGKWVFCEKTMCYDIGHCRDLVQKAHDTGKFVQVGHQRRYNPTYNKGISMAREGIVGRINHIDAQWHRNESWRRPISNRPLTPEEKRFIKTDLDHHLNWRLYKAFSGGLLTELGTHAFDVVNWFLDAEPTRVVGYGGLDYWRDGREVDDNVNVMFEYDITPASGAYRAIEPRNEQMEANPRLNDPYTVRVVYSSITANAQRGASETIQGDEGAMKMTELGSRLYPEQTTKVKWIDDARRADEDTNAIVITTGGTRLLSNQAEENAEPFTVNTDKTVDQLQFEAFAEDIRTGGTPRANSMVGLKSAVCALAALKAIEEKTEVKVDPAWYRFDFETDDTSVYVV